MLLGDGVEDICDGHHSFVLCVSSQTELSFLTTFIHVGRQRRMSIAMHMMSDTATVEVKNLSDDDLIALLCATEDEIEVHSASNEIRELLLDCVMELLRRPELLELEMARAGNAINVD